VSGYVQQKPSPDLEDPYRERIEHPVSGKELVSWNSVKIWISVDVSDGMALDASLLGPISFLMLPGI
jgi:hypothetical protein